MHSTFWPRTFLKDNRSVSALEYAILAAVLGFVLISIYGGIGHKISTVIGDQHGLTTDE